MSERQYTFEVKELQTVSCKCPKCGNLIVFNVLTEEKYGIPQHCATCGAPMEGMARAFSCFRNLHRIAADSGLEIRLHSKPIRSEQGS